MSDRVHAFTDDALGTHDAVALVGLLRDGRVSAGELRAAAVARSGRVTELVGVETPAYDNPVKGDPRGPLAGIPTFIKDNTLVKGLPTGFGSAAFTPPVATHDAPVTTVFRQAGLDIIGKSRLPEFGFNVTTEPVHGLPSRNPWDPDRSTGASSGGAGLLVAAGVVPLAHANDGAGSIRIPAASCGLVGFKPTPGRMPANEESRFLPVPIVVDGVVTRSVRDTALFLSAVEDLRPPKGLPRLGRVTAPVARRLRVGLVMDSPVSPTEPVTRDAVQGAVALLESLGHHVEPLALDLDPRFEDDFILYWGMCALATASTGRLLLSRDFQTSDLDALSLGLLDHARTHLRQIPGAIGRLRGAKRVYARAMARHDVVVSPVLNGVTPLIGELSPTIGYETLIGRLREYVSFTPVHNIVGAPGMSLPLATSPGGLPIGIHFSGRHGDDRTLLALALELEQARPFATIW